MLPTCPGLGLSSAIIPSSLTGHMADNAKKLVSVREGPWPSLPPLIVTSLSAVATASCSRGPIRASSHSPGSPPPAAPAPSLFLRPPLFLHLRKPLLTHLTIFLVSAPTSPPQRGLPWPPFPLSLHSVLFSSPSPWFEMIFFMHFTACLPGTKI